MNDFQECLARSHAAEDLPLWEEVYRKAFPQMTTMVSHRQNGWHQAAGIDRSVILADSRRILIDEKIRGRNKKTGRVYDDIALEYVSNTTTSAPGWVCKPLQCDYIAYAIAPLGRCYLLPVVQLQSAWRTHKDRWMEWARDRENRHFCLISAPNLGYNTLSCCIPPAALFKAIGGCLIQQFAALEWEEYQCESAG